MKDVCAYSGRATVVRRDVGAEKPSGDKYVREVCTR